MNQIAKVGIFFEGKAWMLPYVILVLIDCISSADNSKLEEQNF